MTFTHGLYNGSVIPLAEAVLPVTNIAFSYGFGVYESIRVHKHTPYFMQQHAERLLYSAQIIGLPHAYSAELVSEQVHQLIAAIDSDEVYNIKILLIGGAAAEDAHFFILPSSPLFPNRSFAKKGVQVVSAEYDRQFPQAKTLAMLGSYVAYSKAKTAGAYDALCKDVEGNLIEGTRTNFFAVQGNTIIHAPQERILEGVTKMILLDLARKNEFDVREELIHSSALEQYDGFFITSTSSKVLPVAQIDDYSCAIPESIRTLQQLFSDFYDASSGVM